MQIAVLKMGYNNISWDNFDSSNDLISPSPNETGYGPPGCTYATSTTTYSRNEFLALIEQVVLASIFFLTLGGNFIVLMGIYFRKEKMTRMYYFIMHLGFADLTTAFFQVLPQFAWEITHRFRGGPFWCKFVKYTQILGPYSSSYILVMTALDRYQAICFPLQNCTWTARRSKIMLGTAWTLALLFCVPQVYLFAYQDVGNGVWDCWVKWSEFPEWAEKAYLTWYCISIFIVPLIILIFAYTCITRVIWLNFSMKNTAMLQEQGRGGRKSSEDADDEQSVEESTIQDYRNKRNDNEMAIMANGGTNFQRPRDLQVSWHQNKCGGTTTKTAMSPSLSQINELSTPISHPSCEVLEENYNEGEGAYLPSRNDDNNGKGTTWKNYVNYNEKANTEGSDKRRQIWRSVSLSSSNDSGIHVSANNRRQQHLNSIKREKAGVRSCIETSPPAPKTGIHKTVSAQTNLAQPRAHSVKGISRAKIKTIKLTVTVIVCYIVCSTPFIAALLWSAFDPCAKTHPFYSGPTFTILTLLASLNSCVNAYIILFFNPVLLQGFMRGTCGRICPRVDRRHNASLSLTGSQRQPWYQNSRFGGGTPGGSTRRAQGTSVTGLSPVSLKRGTSNKDRLHNAQEILELIPPGNERKADIVTGSNMVSTNGKSNLSPTETSFTGV